MHKVTGSHYRDIAGCAIGIEPSVVSLDHGRVRHRLERNRVGIHLSPYIFGSHAIFSHDNLLSADLHIGDVQHPGSHHAVVEMGMEYVSHIAVPVGERSPVACTLESSRVLENRIGPALPPRSERIVGHGKTHAVLPALEMVGGIKHIVASSAPEH